MILNPASFQKFPKAETHVHLEGSIQIEMLLELHRRHNLEWQYCTEDEVKQALSFSDFPGFLNSFRLVCRSIRAASDLADITRHFFERLSRENIVHCEFFYTPAAAQRFGLQPEPAVEAILEAAQTEGANRDIGWGLVLDNVRQFPRQSFSATLELARRYRNHGIVGIGMGGDETAAPLNPLGNLFKEARAEGLRIYLHTGETGTAESMLADLESACPDRVGHGLPAAWSTEVRDFIWKHDITLDLCLTSNLRTQLIPNLAQHPVKAIIGYGVPFTLATDDPTLFETNLATEYSRCSSILNESEWLAQLMANQLRNPLLSGKQRDLLTRSAFKNATG